MNMKELRFGIVGCGMVAVTHADAIADCDGAVLVGVYDRSAARCAELAAERGVRAYASYEAMLASTEIDAVCICTPSGLHFEQARAALDAGKHVVLEKPMALNTADAEELVRHAEDAHCILTVISQYRFYEDVVRVKSLIEAGAFGRLTLCDLYMKYWRDPSYYAGSTWRGTWAMDGGGALMNQGIHGVDLMRFLLGDVKLIKGCARTLVHDIEVEDSVAALVEYGEGTLGVIEASTAAYPGFSRRIEIHGTRGYAILVNSALEKLCVDGEMLVDSSIATDAGTSSDPTKLSHRGHFLQFKNFVAAVRGEASLVSTARDGLEAVRLVEGVYRSSASINT